MPKLNINNNHFYYELHGQGEPLVLIAGITCDISMWGGILEQLSQHFQVLVFDNRGVGRTETSALSFTIEDMARDIFKLMQALGIKKAHVLGHSMGGAIAQALAYQYPESVNKLIISHSLIKFKPKSALAFKHMLHLREQNASVTTLTEASVPWVFSNQFVANEDNVENLIALNENNPHPQSLDGYKSQLQALLKFDSQSWFKNISQPTLVLAGAEDIVAPASDLRILAEGIKDAKFVMVPGAHVPMAEAPEDYAKLVLAFINANYGLSRR